MILYPFLAVLLVVLIDIFLIILWKDKQEAKSAESTLPAVSILIAARNEEMNIERCLKSLLQQDYPSDKLQILVGDDDSIDDTNKIANSILESVDNAAVLNITENVSHQRGKANVLAQLAKTANGDYLFVTDADMELPCSWIKKMLTAFDENTAIVTGVTKSVDNDSQSIDWLFGLGMVKVLHDYNVPVTTMGNNMVISRKAYDAVGGYENIPFSITEDLELFKQVNRKGFKVKQLYNSEVLGLTRPIVGFKELLDQRKRWMQGAVQLPWPIVIILFIQAFYFPAIILLFIQSPFQSLALIFVKTVVQGTFIYQCHNSLGLKLSAKQVVNHELYSWIVSCSSLFYYFWPKKVIWKGRNY